MANMLTLEETQARISRSPFNSLLGLRVEAVDEERILLRCVMRPELRGSPTTNAIHGGVLATLVDTSASFAVIVRTGQSIVTIDLRVDYHRPGIAGEFLAEARLVRLGRTVATADTRISDETGTLIASGRAVFMHMPHAPSSDNS